MIFRIAIALVGALAVTCSLLLGMDALTTVFREQSGQRMYRISDVIRRDRSGRPEMPESPTRLPSLPEPTPEQPGNAGVGRAAPAAPAPAFGTPPVVLDETRGRSQPPPADD
jgi:hypothetical protein